MLCTAIILCGVILHITWAWALFLDEGVRGVTSLYELSTWFPYPWTKIVLLTVAGLATVAALSKGMMRTVLALPQQAVLIISALGAVEAMYLSRYADGVLRPQGFIVADQLLMVLFAVVHTFAIIERSEWNGQSRSHYQR